MIRIALCTIALFGFGTAVRAGELDKEAVAKATPAALVSTAPAAKMPAGTELDKESPQAAYHWHGGWGGFRGGWGGGFGGWGYRGFYRPYYGGFYRPYYGGFYGGFYRPYYGGYYTYGMSPFGLYSNAWYW